MSDTKISKRKALSYGRKKRVGVGGRPKTATSNSSAALNTPRTTSAVGRPTKVTTITTRSSTNNSNFSHIDYDEEMNEDSKEYLRSLIAQDFSSGLRNCNEELIDLISDDEEEDADESDIEECENNNEGNGTEIDDDDDDQLHGRNSINFFENADK